MSEKKEKYSIKDFLGFKEVLEYYFRKKEKGRKVDFNLRMMHGINKISIIIFLIALIILIVRHLF